MNLSRAVHLRLQGASIDTPVYNGKSDPPPPPDYYGAAQAQGAANADAARVSAKLSNPTVITPLGTRQVKFGNSEPYFDQHAYDEATRQWNKMQGQGDGFFGKAFAAGAGDQPKPADYWRTGDPDSVTVQDILSPMGQARFDQEQRIVGQLGNLAESGVGRVQQAFAKPFSFGGADDLQAKAEQAYLSRLEPQFQRDDESLRTNLAVRGIDPYGKAATREHEMLNNAKTDARTRAILSAFAMRPQMLQEELAVRNVPLNEINALRTGSQVQLPQFQNYSGATAGAAPVFGAAQGQGQYASDVYNAQTAQDAALMQGLFALGGFALGGPAGAAAGYAAGNAASRR